MFLQYFVVLAYIIEGAPAKKDQVVHEFKTRTNQ